MLSLTADSGSTKTQWLVSGDGKEQRLATQGINPVHQTDDEIREILQLELIPQLPSEKGMEVGSICFYGAGVRDAWKEKIIKLLREAFPHATDVEAESDMLGAARALLGKKSGIACILGTGSNSCLYDGEKIICSVSPLGYILGDEGSGAALGKRLLGDVMKELLPQDVCNAFWQETGETPESIIEKVYRRPLANRYLAGFTKFLAKHRNSAEIQELIIEEFEKFFKRNIIKYGAGWREANFVGSVAYYFSDELHAAASRHSYGIGLILKNPIDKLQ